MSGRTQLVDAAPRYFFHHAFAARKQRNEHSPPVALGAATAYIAMRFQPVNKFHGAVVLQRQPLGQSSNGRLFSFWQTANHQQKKILLWLKSGGLRHGITVVKKMADTVAELS